MKSDLHVHSRNSGRCHVVLESPSAAPLALVAPLVPLIPLINYGKEADFVRQWSHRMPVMTPVVTGEAAA